MKLSPEKPLLLQIFIAMEPAEIRNFGRLWNTTTFIDQGRRPRGMFQLLSLVVPTEASPTLVEHMPKFTNARLILDSGGCSHVPLALVEIIHCNIQGGYSSVATLPLPREACRMADTLNSLTIPTISGGGVDKPLTADVCLEYVHSSIFQQCDVLDGEFSLKGLSICISDWIARISIVFAGRWSGQI